VQLQNLELLKVIVFLGNRQAKLPVDLVMTMQSLGDNAEYIRIEGNGPNALDFHIAFYIGTLAAKHENIYFHIISKDTGFDPLIRHLKSKKILVHRTSDISEIPLLKISNTKPDTEKIDTIIEFLKARGNAKPRTVKTLLNSIDSLFLKELKETELSGLVEKLIKKKVVIRNDTKVSYQLPAD